jgi:ABC-2 type transport system ATP-binding protein
MNVYAQNDGPVLSVKHLSYTFGKKKALDDVCFSVGRGHCAMLLGPNGAGKSTLFALITRLYDARAGRIEINGFDVRKKTSKALAGLGVVFQQPTLDLDLTVLQNLRYHAALHGMSRKEMRRRIHEELERQGMFERRFERVRHLNGGHRRRVEIARALLHQPALLLLDEPSVGLDVPSRQAIVRHVHELSARDRIAVLWATHLIDEVAEDDRVIVLHRGIVRAAGTVADIKRHSGAETIAGAFHRLTHEELAA